MVVDNVEWSIHKIEISNQLFDCELFVEDKRVERTKNISNLALKKIQGDLN